MIVPLLLKIELELQGHWKVTLDFIFNLKSLAQRIGLADFKPQSVTRLGKIVHSRPRLLRFKCANMQEKITLLKGSKNLRNDGQFKKVFVNPDLTECQRKRDKSLREQLKSRRDRGEDVVIYRGEIVQKDSTGTRVSFHSNFRHGF